MTTPPVQNFALALKQLRLASGLTQEELAARSGVSVRSISDLERAISRLPHKDTVALLVKALHLPPEEAERLLRMARASRLNGDEGELAETQLPLVGREGELTGILERLRDPATRLLSLVGIAGIGKTRLALAAVAAAQPLFPAGISVSDLALLPDARYVLPVIAQSLGVREHPARPLAEVLRAWLGEQRWLIVLDNCEHVLAARTEIAFLLDGCPRLAILATSREPLGLTDEHVMRVPPLVTPDLQTLTTNEDIAAYPAVRLFLAGIQAQQSSLELTPVALRTIAKICAHLEGIPLAIELAAARVPTLPPRAILAQLSGTSPRGWLALLRRNPARVPARQQTLHDALAWSYRLLSASEQIVLRRLSLFAGSWTIEAAEAIVDPHRALRVDMQTIVHTLVHKSLVVQEATADDAPRFRMHFMVRAFGANLLAERKETAALQRQYIAYYAELTERLEQALTGVTQAASLQTMIAEYENIRLALQWAREQQAIALGLLLAGTLWWFWENRGWLTEGREWLEGMLALWQQQATAADEATLGRAYYGATILAITQGDAAAGKRLGEACLVHIQAPDKRARVLLMLGNLAKLDGRTADALQSYSEGLAMLRALQDIKGMLVALNNLSTLAIERGDLPQATALLEESLRLKRAVGDRRGEAVSLMNMGEVLKMQCAYAQAREISTRGLAIFAELGDRQGVAMAHNNLGEIAEAEEDVVHAAADYGLSLANYRRMEDRPGIAMTLLHLGRVTAHQRDPQARGILQEGAALYAELDQPVGQVECVLALAALELANQAAPAAWQALEAIAPLFANMPPPALLALRARYLALCQKAQAAR